ncbi:oocyst wall protein precursorhypothetical protein [Cryptosporidium ryanae]|uniref:oocyst wall protein precursorhypothetical protein n=1 Tax=Cryptosporidium ryanae TaxID=515981 RepID=UPI003519FD45|nr:oocyst wall protein precursorhypothetical protein [Cryptosporidium ryanae]
MSNSSKLEIRNIILAIRVLSIILFTVISVKCDDNLRKLLISVRGTPYSDRTIQTVRPISNSSIYSPSRFSYTFTSPKSIDGLIKQDELNDILRSNIRNMQFLNNSNGSDLNESHPKYSEDYFNINYSLRLILANIVIKSNDILYPFEIEYKNETLCLCTLNNKVKNGFNETLTPELPPNCVWLNESNRKDMLESKNLESNINSNNNGQSNVRNGSHTNYNEMNNLENESTVLSEIQEFNEEKLDNNIEIDIEGNTNQKHKNSSDTGYNEGYSFKNDTNENFTNNTNLGDHLNKTKQSFIKSKRKVNNILIKSPDNLIKCYYKVPVDITPWRVGDNNYTVNSEYWLNYTSYDSSVWNSIEFKRKNLNKNEYNNIKFSIEGFWDLFRQIPNELLLQLDIKDENTYNLCQNKNDKKELSLIDDYISIISSNDTNTYIKRNETRNLNLNAPKFSSLNVVPYNNTYCSRPTGAEMDIVGICPSGGLNSFYDKKVKSCVSITYADSTANCPQNYIHSKLWGSHRGGGGCHSKQRKYISPIPACDPPFIFNEPRKTCIVEKYVPGFPGCIEGSVYYNLQTCIMAYQVMKEFSCPEGYYPTLVDEEEDNNEREHFETSKMSTDKYGGVTKNENQPETEKGIQGEIYENVYNDIEILNKDVSDVNYRIKTLNKAKSNFYDNYDYNNINNNNPFMTKIVSDDERGIQSKYITKKFVSNKKVKCTLKIEKEVKYDGIGSPYCDDRNYMLKYKYNNLWMFENGPKPYCEYKDIKYVDYRCPKGTVSYDIYISSGNDPPLVIRDEFFNPFDTCVEVKVVPLQPKCQNDEIPFIYIREPVNNYERKGIHIVSKEDIKNLNKNLLFNPSDVIDNSIPDILNNEYSNDNNNDSGNNNKNPVLEFIELNKNSSNNYENINRKLIDDEYLNHEPDINKELKLKLKKKPIRLYDAIVGNTDYIVKIICSNIIEAKPYLSCPENSVLVNSNMCKLKGYTDFNIMCPDGYELDEEALILMPIEHNHKYLPRCVSKQKVFTHYYCPPIFPESVYRPFIVNNTLLNNMFYENSNKSNYTNHFKFDNITNTRILSEKSFGRTIVPSYFQKMCHEVDLIKPIWKMPNLLKIFLLNFKGKNS